MHLIHEIHSSHNNTESLFSHLQNSARCYHSIVYELNPTSLRSSFNTWYASSENISLPYLIYSTCTTGYGLNQFHWYICSAVCLIETSLLSGCFITYLLHCRRCFSSGLSFAYPNTRLCLSMKFISPYATCFRTLFGLAKTYKCRIWCQKQGSRAYISNYIPQFLVGCNY